MCTPPGELHLINKDLPFNLYKYYYRNTIKLLGPGGEKRVEITKDMTINQTVSKFPKTVDVFKRHGMGCFG